MRGTAALLLVAGLASPQDYPPAPGFDLDGSDPEAVSIANEVMEALGGYEAWNETRFLTWKFFGRRTHVWDKHTGNLRFENEGTIVLMNLNTKQGRAFENGEEILDDAKREEALQRAYGAWINDAYWVFMPYKLKDTGVTLRYLGNRTTEAGAEADVLELTFESVGLTPENKYHVYVDKTTRLVTQWDYYPKATDSEPGFKIPWQDWKRYGAILLSADRGERKHENLAVLENVPDSVFESPAPLDPLAYAR
ncbi:MAG TPA: hypothetical protein VEK15_15755 [Vicinamibacteria bacterium]|nr:hypothetical protein [Vicinamibacteria bacterium]